MTGPAGLARKPALFLLALFTCFLAVYFTGTLAPRYRVIARTPEGETSARRYQPVLSPDPDPPRLCYWEMLPPKDGNKLLPILYRFSWPDETHPKAWADIPYRLFRRLWFGTLEDVEYVLVEVDMTTGEPARIAFESPELGAILVGHKQRVLQQGEFKTAGPHPVLRVASWNHIFEPADQGGEPAPLEYLDDARFAALRVGLRSQPPGSLLDSGTPPTP